VIRRVIHPAQRAEPSAKAQPTSPSVILLVCRQRGDTPNGEIILPLVVGGGRRGAEPHQQGQERG